MSAFENVAVGDSVAVISSRGIDKRVVERVTKTTFSVNGMFERFMRLSGRYRGSSQWHPCYAFPWSDEYEQQLREQQNDRRLHRMRCDLETMNWESVPPDLLESIYLEFQGKGIIGVEKSEGAE